VKITLTINGEKKIFDIAPDEKLAKLLRREGYVGVKEGCDEGTCGACTVIMDDRAVLSCTTYAALADGRDIRTIEGVGDFDKPHPLQEALVRNGAVQCGYCIPGMIMSATALMKEIAEPSDDDIKTYMDGNFCRCTGYEKIWDALREVISGEGGGR